MAYNYRSLLQDLHDLFGATQASMFADLWKQPAVAVLDTQQTFFAWLENLPWTSLNITMSFLIQEQLSSTGFSTCEAMVFGLTIWASCPLVQNSTAMFGETPIV